MESNSRLEPMKNWIESTQLASKLAFSKDFCCEKSLLKKIGSNLILMDKKIQMNLVAPYNLIAKYKKLGEEADKNKKGDEVKKPSSPIWLTH